MKDFEARIEIAEIRKMFRHLGPGKTLEKKARRRMELQLSHPDCDPMLESWRPIAEKYRDLFSGRILDAGCFTGYLYHFLGKPEGYVGIDVCPEFIKVAKEFAPESDFRLQDVMTLGEHFDVAWCSQIAFPEIGMSATMTYEKLQQICDTLIFVVAREHAEDFNKPAERIGRMLVSVWKK